MSDNLIEKVNAPGERLKIGGSEVGQKISAGVTSVSFKMECFQDPTQADKFVEEATAETLPDPDCARNLELCDMMKHERVNTLEIIRGIKKRITLKIPQVQYLSLVLLETIAKNCDKAFSEIAAERVLDEMVKLIDDPQTVIRNRNKALILIEAWGESSDELRYLPVYEETYKSLRSLGISFPGRNTESLAPIFTPPPSVPIVEPHSSIAQGVHHEVPVQSFSAEQTKEAFNVARNSIELLSTVISSSPEQDALQKQLQMAGTKRAADSQHSQSLPNKKLRRIAFPGTPYLTVYLDDKESVEAFTDKFRELASHQVTHLHKPTGKEEYYIRELNEKSSFSNRYTIYRIVRLVSGHLALDIVFKLVDVYVVAWRSLVEKEASPWVFMNTTKFDSYQTDDGHDLKLNSAKLYTACLDGDLRFDKEKVTEMMKTVASGYGLNIIMDTSYESMASFSATQHLNVKAKDTTLQERASQGKVMESRTLGIKSLTKAVKDLQVKDLQLIKEGSSWKLPCGYVVADSIHPVIIFFAEAGRIQPIRNHVYNDFFADKSLSRQALLYMYNWRKASKVIKSSYLGMGPKKLKCTRLNDTYEEVLDTTNLRQAFALIENFSESRVLRS